MGVVVTVHQPQYLPWLGYFDKMRRADVFCYLDNVQYKKNEWQNRNRIKTAPGWQWLTVPVRYRFPQKIREVAINNAVSWRRKHLQALRTNYARTPHFKRYIGLFEAVYAVPWERLVDLNIEFIERLRKALGLDRVRTLRASEMQLSEDPSRRLADICRQAGGDTYLAGTGARDYMELEPFQRYGIRVQFQDYPHPRYPQAFGDFQSHLSVVDLLFNCGPESLRRISGAAN